MFFNSTYSLFSFFNRYMNSQFLNYTIIKRVIIYLNIQYSQFSMNLIINPDLLHYSIYQFYSSLDTNDAFRSKQLSNLNISVHTFSLYEQESRIHSNKILHLNYQLSFLIVVLDINSYNFKHFAFFMYLDPYNPGVISCLYSLLPQFQQFYRSISFKTSYFIIRIIIITIVFIMFNINHHSNLAIPTFSHKECLQTFNSYHQVIPTSIKQMRESIQIPYNQDIMKASTILEVGLRTRNTHYKERLEDLYLKYADGCIYRGQGIPPSQRHGMRVLFNTESQEVYSGEWFNNLYEGFGILINQSPHLIKHKIDPKDLNTIEDSWNDYKGYFKQIKCIGKKFEGHFINGMIHGKGRFYGDQIIVGNWLEGVLI
ncbi:unnamed protein product (macronuclear) [Paramecium tetraurelia]|uniref:Uncharacterized protein n=1 Tax=Paramecium tetraurelia TaxID=5888 RepID=A0BND1_PARTE|nr:uncharacterized protein GSPATT00030686001 [Paramecium tetraurelia]CAK60048.1 unnamed protein product [Paramecium tetraurelia]|eukprot:XP_001427446.1 hypothetical protein (macronuclear) [Paramecium tetraurelia strain d4-2]